MAICAAWQIVSVHAGPMWTETKDAGDLPATVQHTFGTGPLAEILGNISVSTDADMYGVFITGLEPFSASTVGTGGTLEDTQLFLFDAAGLGVYANDDAASDTFRSRLPAGHPLTPMSPGLYYLVITGFNRDPVSTLGLIFPNEQFGSAVGPTGPGGGSPVTGYTGQSPSSSYRIIVAGTTFSNIPEPGTAVLTASAIVALVVAAGRRCFRRRR